ncbi:MAG TPA: NADH-quinone oxidoreductase subunit A [Gemmatimonadales bacterium]|jgi:NADH-quinone oxidoreductase subunit A|nr:NADH-quinone oxidoreductase subunit A [Gemmatimonadales bacterium]
MDQAYIAFLLLLVFVAANAVLLIGLSHLAAPNKPTAAKLAPYESGMPPLGDARERFSVKFYLTAMLFIVFDIETVFLIPWGAIYFADGAAGAAQGPGMGFLLAEMLVFLLILFVGYVYVWKRGAFQWN